MALPAPHDLAAPPRQLLAELAAVMGERDAAGYCADLLGGADPSAEQVGLLYVGGRPAASLTVGSRDWFAWPPVWGARGLLYVWDDSCSDAAVDGASAPAWRVAEMSLKVVAKRELGAAAPAAVGLLSHELPRVRASALRALGLIGDTEHVDDVLARLQDPDEAVRAAAWRACNRLERRLDVVIGPR